MMDYIDSQPDLVLSSAWARNSKTNGPLSTSLFNFTMFIPTDAAAREGIYRYSKFLIPLEAVLPAMHMFLIFHQDLFPLNPGHKCPLFSLSN